MSSGPSSPASCSARRPGSNGSRAKRDLRVQALVGLAVAELTADDLSAIASEPDATCDRCYRELFGYSWRLTLEGPHVTGSKWDLCAECLTALYRFLGINDPNVNQGDKPPAAPSPDLERQR